MLLPFVALLLLVHAAAAAGDGVHLLIGVKSRAQNHARRDALRKTWFRLQQHTVDMRFLVGVVKRDAPGGARVRASLAGEQAAHGDLLMGELGVRALDTYATLLQKSLGFMAWATTTRHFDYLMLTDDDVYLRVDGLVNMLASRRRERLYLGQVWATEHSTRIYPTRDEGSRYFVAPAAYPHEAFPPFAIGPHLILSRDLVAFLGRNREDLMRSAVGVLEDVSIAWWLRTLLAVAPTHSSLFFNARDGHHRKRHMRRQTGCRNDLLSYADLRVPALLAIHENLQRGKPFCDGFNDDWSSWNIYVKYSLAPPKGANASIPSFAFSVRMPTEMESDSPVIAVHTQADSAATVRVLRRMNEKVTICFAIDSVVLTCRAPLDALNLPQHVYEIVSRTGQHTFTVSLRGPGPSSTVHDHHIFVSRDVVYAG